MIRSAASIDSATDAFEFALVERLRRGEGVVHLVEPGRLQAVVALLVQRQPRVDDARLPLDPLDHLLRAGHLRHAGGVDEADRLDARHARGREPVHELGPGRGRERLRIVLQPVAWSDVTDGHLHRTPSAFSSSSSSPARPSSPPYTSSLWLPSSQVADQRTSHGRVGELGDDAGRGELAELGVDLLEQHVARPGTAGPRRCPRSCRSGRRSRRPRSSTRSISAASRARPTRPTIASISAWWSPRARWVAKRGSSASSGCSIASARRRKTLSALAAITMLLPSRDSKMLEGATPCRPVPPGSRTIPQPVVLRHRALEQRETGLHQRDVDHLARRRRARRAGRGRRGCPATAYIPASESPSEMCIRGGVLAGEAVDVADAAHRLGDRGEAGAGRVGPGLPVAGHARDHEPRIGLEQLVRPELPALERARAEVLDQRVRVLGELEQQLLPAFGAQVERCSTSCSSTAPATTASGPRSAPCPSRAAGRAVPAARS